IFLTYERSLSKMCRQRTSNDRLLPQAFRWTTSLAWRFRVTDRGRLRLRQRE
ncbi:unnamed protein product, partial [Ectocarpus fasciculatus]